MAGFLRGLIIVGVSALTFWGNMAFAQEADLFPPALHHWERSEPHLSGGIAKAEELRHRLLAPGENGHPPLARLCNAFVEFQRQMKASSASRRTVEHFDLRTSRVEKQLRGLEPLSPEKVFRAFEGRWFGDWDGIDVNHAWRPAQVFHPAKQLGPLQPGVLALQYAWIGNGFGWNYLVSLSKDSERRVILGMVYYLRGEQLREITGEKAHVGFADAPTRLVWLTEREIFLEEVFRENDSEKYAITAIYHDVFGNAPRISPQAVQAVYTRDPQHRPQFHKFEWMPPQSKD